MFTPEQQTQIITALAPHIGEIILAIGGTIVSVATYFHGLYKPVPGTSVDKPSVTPPTGGQ